jgi:hypothetical protein
MYHPGVYFHEAFGLHNTVTGLITASDWLQWIMERHAQQDAVSHQAKRLNSRGKIRNPRRGKGVAKTLAPQLLLGLTICEQWLLVKYKTTN